MEKLPKVQSEDGEAERRSSLAGAEGNSRTQLAQVASLLGVSHLVAERRPIPRLRSEVDYYGAGQLIADRLGWGEAPSSRCAWLHGWSYYPLEFPERFLHAIPEGERESATVLVANRGQEEVLRNSGYSGAKAVGLPFCYTRSGTVPRLPNSLLIMPYHTATNLKRSRPIEDERAYLESLAPYFKHFDLVALCVYSDCLEQGHWIEVAAEFDLPVFQGADIRDGKSLARTRAYCDLFSAMTTNAIGSHVLYGLSCGQRVSWFGKKPSFSEEEMLQHPFYERHPEIAAFVLDLHRKDYDEETLGWLRAEPHKGVRAVDWARAEAGWNERLPAEEMARLLGWKEPGRSAVGPQKQAVDAPRLDRWADRLAKGIAALDKGGRRNLRARIRASVDALRGRPVRGTGQALKVIEEMREFSRKMKSRADDGNDDR